MCVKAITQVHPLLVALVESRKVIFFAIFFDDWPRTKDSSTLSRSDVEDEKPNRNSSTIQLSISIPISIPISSSDFNATGSPPSKLKLSPLKLSMSKAGEDDIPLGVELGVRMGLGINEERQRHHQANWIPIAWETSVGGPLAEALQSSTPRASKNSGLNLMTKGWEEGPRDSSHIDSSSRGFMGAMISNLAFVFRNIFSKKGMKARKSVGGMNYHACLSITSLVYLMLFAFAMKGPKMWAEGW